MKMVCFVLHLILIGFIKYLQYFAATIIFFGNVFAPHLQIKMYKHRQLVNQTLPDSDRLTSTPSMYGCSRKKSNPPFASNGLTLHAFHLAGHAACPAHAGSPPRRAATGEGKAESFGAGTGPFWFTAQSWSVLAHVAELVCFGSRSRAGPFWLTEPIIKIKKG